MEKRPCEDSAWRKPFPSQGERLQKTACPAGPLNFEPKELWDMNHHYIEKHLKNCLRQSQMPGGLREATEVGNVKGLPWQTHNPRIRDRSSQLQIIAALGSYGAWCGKILLFPPKRIQMSGRFYEFVQFLKPWPKNLWQRIEIQSLGSQLWPAGI